MRKHASRASKGLVVLLAGPDGVGKTTLAAAIEERFGPDRVEMHWQRPSILPRKTPRNKATITDPHGAPTYSRPLSALKVLYVLVDTLLGWTFRVLPARRRGSLVVIERGWWDMVVDPSRYRLRGVHTLLRASGRLLPKPDLAVVLAGDAEAVAARKMDLTLDELIRQMARWRELQGVAHSRRILDPSATAMEVATLAEEAIRSSLPG